MMSMETGNFNLLGTPGGIPSSPGGKLSGLYNKTIKPNLVRVTRRHDLVKCDYYPAPESGPIKSTPYGCKVHAKGDSVSLHHLVYRNTVGDITGKNIEVYRKCQNDYCVRPAHLIKGKPNAKISLPRLSCKGFIRFGSNDQLAMVCNHKSDKERACQVVTDYTDIEADISDVPTTRKCVKGCYGFVKCGDLLARVCTHKRACSTITDIEDIRASAADVDPAGGAEDSHVTKFMTREEYKNKYGEYGSGEEEEPEEESEEESEEEEPERFLPGTRRSTRKK